MTQNASADELCDLSTGVCPRCGLDVDRRGITRALRIGCRSAVDGGYLGRVRELPDAGPGTELKRLLAAVGLRVDGSCSCNRRAREMDRRGVAWCRANLETIVDWLREEAQRRKSAAAQSMAEHQADPPRRGLALPAARPVKPLGWLLGRKFRPWVARILIRWAIRRAQRTESVSSAVVQTPPR